MLSEFEVTVYLSITDPSDTWFHTDVRTTQSQYQHGMSAHARISPCHWPHDLKLLDVE